MAVPVMDVGIVRMRVHDPLVLMRVRVRFPGRVARRVRVMVMLVVPMEVSVEQRLVNVLMLVALGEVQP